jgi:MFS family permease
VSIARRLTAIRILQPLRHRDFRLLIAGRAVSMSGDGFFIVALAWQVYLIDNDPIALSLVGFAGTVPLLVFVLIGGALTDRYDRRLLMIGADLVRAVAIGGLGLLAVTGQVELWHIALVEAVAGVASAFFNPASTAIVPDVLPAEDLAQANALTGILRRLTISLIGPAAGGLLIAAFGPGPAFLIDGVSFLVSALFVFTIRTRPALHHDVESGVRQTIVHMKEGFRYVRSKPWIWSTLLSAMLSLLFFVGPVQVLVPFLVKNRLGLGPDALGGIYAVGALGPIVMAFAIGHYGLPRLRITVMYGAWALGIAFMAVYGVMDALWQALAVTVVINALFELGEVIWTTLLQQLVPRRLLGRVSSLDWMLSTGLVPVSFALTGPISNAIGAGTTMVGGALVGAVLFVVLLFFVPGVRDPERRDFDDAAESGQSGEDLVGL